MIEYHHHFLYIIIEPFSSPLSYPRFAGAIKISRLLDERVVRSEERRRSAQEHVSDDTQGPHVARLRVVPLEDLGRDVVGGADDARHDLGPVEVAGEAEVDELEVAPRVRRHEDPVLEFEVPVGDLVVVHVADGGEHLSDRLCSVSLRDAVLGVSREEVEEVAAAPELSDDEELVVDAQHVLEL